MYNFFHSLNNILILNQTRVVEKRLIKLSSTIFTYNLYQCQSKREYDNFYSFKGENKDTVTLQKLFPIAGSTQRSKKYGFFSSKDGAQGT